MKSHRPPPSSHGPHEPHKPHKAHEPPPHAPHAPHKLALALLGAALALVATTTAPAAPAPPAPVRALTFNLRNSRANDGANAWEHRRDSVADVILRHPDGHGPYDFIGTQETVIHPDPDLDQRGFLATRLAATHALIGRSRDKTPDNGEGMVLYYKKDRWRLDPRDNGTFWLSLTPDDPGSKYPGLRHARTAAYGLFHELDAAGAPTGRKLYVYDTHLDHTSEPARQHGAKILMERVAARKDQTAPVIIMGDMNCGEKSAPILYFQGKETPLDGVTIKSPLALTDTFRAANPNEKKTGTFTGFKQPGKEKIDYIFVSPPLKTLSSKIIRTRRDDGGYPSDHFPVEAVLTWEK
jgi:endonuclease/exonuclease/phosphatase family metal-dependent hydrolase